MKYLRRGALLSSPRFSSDQRLLNISRLALLATAIDGLRNGAVVIGIGFASPANVQDVHRAVPLLERVAIFPKLRHVFADRVYRGKQLVGALSHCGPWTIEIVQRPAGVKGFQLLPRRWVVERTFDWFGRCRRLAKDFEAPPPKPH